MKKVITIHQPNFCPYHGFFQKMEQADLLVLLTCCQFEKNGYQNRFKHDDKWHTMRINKGMEPIITKRYIDADADWTKIVKTFPVLTDLDIIPTPHMASMNYQIIKNVSKKLGINTKIAFDFPTYLTSTARLVEIVQRFGGTHYLSGISGEKYMDMSLWEKAGIDVIFQDESTLSKKSLIQIL